MPHRIGPEVEEKDHLSRTSFLDMFVLWFTVNLQKYMPLDTLLPSVFVPSQETLCTPGSHSWSTRVLIAIPVEEYILV